MSDITHEYLHSQCTVPNYHLTQRYPYHSHIVLFLQPTLKSESVFNMLCKQVHVHCYKWSVNFQCSFRRYSMSVRLTYTYSMTLHLKKKTFLFHIYITTAFMHTALTIYNLHILCITVQCAEISFLQFANKQKGTK